MLWDKLMVIQKTKCQDWDKIWRNFQQNPLLSFKKIGKPLDRFKSKYDTEKEIEKNGYGDEMIIDRRTGFVKGKYLHQQGIVTKAQYVPFSQNVEARGYTGLFQSGA